MYETRLGVPRFKNIESFSHIAADKNFYKKKELLIFKYLNEF